MNNFIKNVINVEKDFMEHLIFIKRLFNYQDIQIKTIAIFSAITSFFISFANNYLGISIGLFVVLVCIMFTDLFTGLVASYHEEKLLANKENRPMLPLRDIYKSKKGLGWIFKLGSYMMFLYLSIELMEHIESYNIDFLNWFMRLLHLYVLIHIFYWETKSVDENFERLGYTLLILKLMKNLFNSINKLLSYKLKSKDDK